MDFSQMSDEELLKPDAQASAPDFSQMSDEELLKPDAQDFSQMSDEELLKPDAQQNKQDLGFWERKRLELEAKTGDKTSWGELAVNKTVGFGIDELKETVDEYSEQRLMKGEEDNPLKMVELARRIGLTQEQIDRVTARADSGKRSIGGFKLAPNADVLKQGFAELAKAKVAERVRTREAAQQRLANAEEQSTMGAIGSGVVDMASMPLKFANPATIGATTMINIGNRTGALHRDTYTLDEDGNPVLVKEGDSGTAALVKGTAGGVAETLVWTKLNKIGGSLLKPVGKAITKIPGVGKLFDGAVKGVAGAGEKLAAKLGKSEGGRLALKTVDVLGDIEDKIHLGSLPGMVAKTRITEFLDDVVGLNAREGEREKFGEWLGKVTSVEDNVRLLTGLIGFHAITAGVGAYRAHRFNKEFRGTGREEIVGEFIGADRAKKLSNEDLEMMYRIVTSPGLTAEKAGEFLDGLKGDLKAAGEQLQGELARRREVTPEQEEKLDAKIAEYAGGNETIAEKVKADILSKMQDSRAIDMPEMLDEMVAMSAREYEPESRRMKVHDLRGSGKTEGEKLSGIEELGVTSWEAAEAEGLTEKDRFGRYGGGARRALHISIEGTEKLKAAVKAGEISGEIAEELLTAAQCELGARPAEERAALIDGIIDRARGDEALARRMIERLEEEDRSNAVRPSMLEERLDRAAAEAKVDAIKERNPGASDAEARGAAVEPVETEDGRMTTLGEVVGAGVAPSPKSEEGPQSALEGVEMAERLKGTKLKAVGGGWMTTEKFPELRVSVSSEGVEAVGLSAEMMAKPENTADVAAVLAQMTRIAKRNGVGVMFPDQASADIAKAIVREVKEQGLAKAQAKLDTRSKLFNLLFKTALGTGVTYDEAGFKEGLAKVSNGRQFIDKHGNIYGFVDGEGGVHFNPVALNFNTPIHEYGHLALEAIKGFNNKLWQRGMDLVKESDYYREIERQSEIEGHEYSYLKGKVDQICDEALATMIGDRGERLVTEKGLEAPLKAWLKEFWKAFKGAFGLADLSDEQVERMTLAEFADAVNAELLKGGEFGTKKKIPPSERSVRRYDEAEGSGSNGMLRWKNDRGYLFAIPVDQEKTKPGGKVVFATDDANVTDWIKSRLNGVELRMSKTGKIYVKGRNGLDGELAEIFGRFPKAGQNDGIFDTLAAELGDETWRSATPDKLVEALAKDRANYDKWVEARKSGKTTEQTQLEQHYAEEAAREEAEERERFKKSGMSVIDYVRSRAEEGEPPFDIDWEIAREIAHEEAEGRFAVGGIFTGTAADYANRSRKGGVDDGPSLKKIGTGEGSQVYGWGLYGSTVRGVAEVYMDDATHDPRGLAKNFLEIHKTKDAAIKAIKKGLKQNAAISDELKNTARKAIKILQSGKSIPDTIGNLYEQTFFTNRAPGDESHLLMWYRPVEGDQRKWIEDALQKENLVTPEAWGAPRADGAFYNYTGPTISFSSGDSLYRSLTKLLGSPKAASEFLARAGIDGVKYPVDSYGGKGVKDGDKVGWNYVSFRDDNIRVDHKWTDGVAKFAVGKVETNPNLKEDVAAAVNVDRNKGKIVPLRKVVEFSKTPPFLIRLGVPDANIISRADILRKIKGKHLLTEDQIADLPNRYASPVAVMKDGRNYVILTDMDAPTKTSGEKPVMVYLKAVGNGAKHNFIASAYAREANKEQTYVDLVRGGKLIYMDENRIAVSKLEDATLLQFKPQAVRGDSKNIIAQTDAGAQGGAAKLSAGREDWSWLDESIFQVKPSLATVAMGELEQKPAGLAAAVEKREALRPWTKKQSPADLAKPIAFDAADMVMFWRAVSGSLRNPHVQKGERIKGRPSAIGLNVGGDRIEIVSKLFGVIDASDVKTLREACKADGFFQNEDPDWAAKRSKASVQAEIDRSNAELDKRTRELFRKRVETGEGGEHYATEVLGHEIGHTLGLLPAGAQLGPVGNAAMTLYKAMEREWKRQISETRKVGDAAKNVKGEITRLIAWWHGQEKMPDYYRKPNEMFAELFGIFLTQPESVQAAAPHAYDACVKIIAGNDKLAAAYRKIAGLKWSGKSNDRVMDEVRKTWEKEAQDQYRKLRQMSRESVSLKRDWFSYALNDRFGPMFNIARRGLAAEKKLLEEAVRTGAMSEAEAKDRLAEKEAEINALKTSLYDWQRQSGGQTRLMIAEFDEVRDAAERDGTSWNDVRDYAHLMRVIELGGRATAHGMDPARASATLEDMQKRMGAAAFANVEKTWKAFRAVYERSVLEDANVREIFDDATMKLLYENKHYVTMKHRMGVEESAEWQRRIEEYRKGNKDAWDPCIDIQERLHRGFGSGGDGERGFVLHRLEGSFEATEDPLAATIRRAIEIKESAARNHLLKQMSETLRTLGAKGVYDTAIEKGAKPRTVDGAVYGKLAYMEGGVRHELIVPKVVYKSFKTENTSFGAFGAAMRFIRNTMTLWNPMFINRAYLVDKSALETNLKGMHKAPIDVLSEAFCIRGIGVPLYLANNYLTRFTPIANTWVGKLLWNENTANHYAHQAQKIARICYEGKFGERLSEARELREMGETGKAAEIEQNVAIAKEMLRRNVFQSAYEFNRDQAGFDTDAIMQQFGYRIDGGKDPATWLGRVWAKTKAAGRWWNRFEEEQEAVTKIIAYLYEMKKGGDADAVARTVIEQGGTPNLAARGVFASYIENATGFFWNVRKEGLARTWDALKDHPTEWICKNLAQIALPALLKCLMKTGGLEEMIRSLFDDDDEKVKRSWWAPAVIEHARFMNAAMKCVPGYYQRNYNIIPLAKFGDHVLSMRVKYSPEEFAAQNAIHTAFQMFGKDPTDPDADWSTLANGMWSEFLPDIFGRNYALDAVGTIVGPLLGVNPYDNYRQRNIYDDATWKTRWDKPGHMMQEIGKNFWNYSPLGTFTATFKNGQERRLEDTDVPAWLDRVLATPVVSRIPASMLTITSSDTYVKALGRVDQKRRAYAKLVAQDILADCIANGRLGGFDDALKDLPPELRVITIRHVINGWRQYHMDPAAKTLKRMRAIKDPHLKARARQWIEDGMKDD